VKKGLRQYHWPGNVRELENVIERLAILCDGPMVDLEDLPDDVMNSSPADETAPSGTELLDLRELEKQTISRALSKTGGNRTKAAELLGFSVRTLRNKLKEYKELPHDYVASTEGVSETFSA